MKYLQFSWFLLPWLGGSGAFLMVPTSPSFTTGTIPTRVRGGRSNNMPLLSLPNQHSLRMISTTEEAFTTDNKAEMEHASSKTNVGDHTSTKNKTNILGNKVASPLSFLDMNGDGKIDIQDLKVLAEKVGELMDLNGDGKVDGQDLKIAFQNMLDVNGDGKVDGQDIQFLTSKLQDSMYNVLDVNNDGKVDREDAKTALTLALISGVLLTSPLPAHAKGGGGHGGGHSSSRSSSRSSSSRVSENDRSYPEYKRTHSPGFPSLDPKICFNLPEQGERIEILRDEYTGYYVPAAVVDVNDSTSACRFTAAPFDGKRPVSLHSFPNHCLYEWLTGFIFIYGKNSEMRREVEFDAQFNALPTPVPGKSTRPLESGTFRGASYEKRYIDDDVETIEQDVETMLQFMENGDISGSGFDSDDGEYELSGMWKVADDGNSYLLRWKETYDDFDVKVQCDMKMSDADEDDQTWVVNGYFRSSRDVRGYFNMEL